MKQYMLLLMALLSIIAPVCASNPESSKPSGEFERGLEATEAIITQLGLLDDEDWNDKVNTIGYRIASCIEDRTCPFVFNNVKMKEANAFALPGGFIFITEGMQKLNLSDDELAHLLGHEMAHANLRHYAKMERKAALWSVLHQLLLAGIIFGMKDSANPHGATVAPGPSQGDDGKVAAFEGTLLFGQIFRDLLQRGYSREIEIEADETGCKYATAAGFKPEAGEALLEKLHKRFYEAPGMHYWRTHPYFNERVIAAQARTKFQVPLEPVDKLEEHKTSLQKELIEGAEEQKSPLRKQVLFKAALHIDTKSDLTFKVYDMILQQELEEERQKNVYLRSFAPLITQYDKSISLLKTINPTAEIVTKLQSQRDSLEKEKSVSHGSYVTALDSGAMDKNALERFIKNFPDDPRRCEAEYWLGENFRLLKDAEHAVEHLLQCIELEKTQQTMSWTAKAQKSLELMIPACDNLNACYQILNQFEPLQQQAKSRMDVLAEQFEDLKVGSDFIHKWGETTDYSPIVRIRLNKLGEQKYTHGRQLEAIGQYQKAMDVYNLILDYVPSDEILDNTYARIEYVQTIQKATPA